MTYQLDLTDIQGNVLVAYRLPFARYLFYQVNDGLAARSSLTHLIPLITTSEHWEGGKPNVTTDAAFSYRGLERLELPPESLAQFPTEFQMGMRARAHILNDVRKNAPENWDQVWQNGEVDVLLSVYAITPEELGKRVKRIENLFEEHGGLRSLGHQDANVLFIDGKPTRKEHFGYNDGIGNPDIEGAGLGCRPGRGKPLPDGTWAPIKTGEFVLGYEDEAGEVPPAPEPHLLSRNGTFLVYRKLHQNVGAFRDYLEEQGKKYPGGKAKLAAKLIGRWEDGTPLSLSPNEPDPHLAADSMRNNDFSYDDDPNGARVPLGSHIRRMNPRETFGLGGKIANRHRIARRGLPYGEWCPIDQKPKDSEERGVIFMTINASIKRQFEFIWQQWVNYGNDFKQGNDRDPVAGNHTGSGKMVIQGDPDNPESSPAYVCPELPQFVEVRGGDYFFVPSLTALRLIADGSVAEHLANESIAAPPAYVKPLPVPPAPAPPVVDEILDDEPSFFRWLISLPLAPFKMVLGLFGGIVKWWMSKHPRSFFWMLRTFRPVAKLGKLVLVSRYQDVVQVLNSDQQFHVTYGEKMRRITAGDNFFLGMQPSPEYTLNVTNMRNAVRPEDIPSRLARPLEELASQIVDDAGGALDVVSQLGLVAPPAVITHYFGTPADGLPGFAEKASVMFRYIFVPQNPETIDQRALHAAAQMRDYIDRIICRRKEYPTQDDDVINRCLKMQNEGVPGMHDLGIRNNLIGLIVGAVATISKCAAQALDQLLDRREVLEGAHLAAKHSNDDLLSRYVFEALRFNPNNPGLFRRAAADVTLGSTRFGRKTIKKGTTVFALTHSAMFDKRRVAAPNEFRIDRPQSDYLHFGSGMHECFGRFISRALIPAVLKPLLRQHDLGRADGNEGRLQMDGTSPRRLFVTYQPSRSDSEEPK